MCTCNFYKYEHAYTYRKKEFQNILESKKIMQLVWTVVTCLILGYSRKTPNRKVENMEFPGISKKGHVEFPGVN